MLAPEVVTDRSINTPVSLLIERVSNQIKQVVSILKSHSLAGLHYARFIDILD